MHHKSFLYPWFLKSDVKVICSSNFVTGNIELELHVGFWFRTLKIFLFWGLPIQVDVLIPSLCDVLLFLLVFLLLSAVCNVVFNSYICIAKLSKSFSLLKKSSNTSSCREHTQNGTLCLRINMDDDTSVVFLLVRRKSKKFWLSWIICLELNY